MEVHGCGVPSRHRTTRRGVAGRGGGPDYPPQLGPGPLVRLTQIWGDFWREVGGVRDRVRTLLVPNVIMEFVFWNDITVYFVIGASVLFANRQVAYLKVQ